MRTAHGCSRVRGNLSSHLYSPPGTSVLTVYHVLCRRYEVSCSTFVGALAQAFTSDRFGRRGSILIWSAIFTVGTAIQTATIRSITQITIGRFIAGLGVGALSGRLNKSHPSIVFPNISAAIVPLYNGETAPKAMRGMLLVLYQLQIIIGQVHFRHGIL